MTVMINEHTNSGRGPSHMSDSENLRLQILTAEHWSLLSTRSLTYSESLSRVIIFLSVLSVSVVALALLAQIDHLRETFLAAAIPVLCVVLFVGVSTIVRLSELNREDLERYFLTDTCDDLEGLLRTMDMDMAPGRWTAHEVIHGFQTLPTTLSVIVAVIAAVLAALVAVWFGASTMLTVAAATAVFLVTTSVLALLTRHSFSAFVRDMPTRFPSTAALRSS